MTPTSVTRRIYLLVAGMEKAWHRGRRRRDCARAAAKAERPFKLHVGCGSIRLEGWINTDFTETPGVVDFAWDATEHFPFEDGSCGLIYNEHFLEHLPVDQGLLFLKQCHRLLRPGGILRIAMPSLEAVVHKYCSEEWKDQAWLKLPAFRHIATRCEMLNASMRWWDHQWVYDREELRRRLQEAGFFNIRECRVGESEEESLRNLETRPDSLLICEAIR